MSLDSIKDFLNDELNLVNNDINNLDRLITENNLHIDEINYFIEELSSVDKTSLSLSYISEKEKTEKLKLEKETLNKFLSSKKNYDEKLILLNSKKNKLIENINYINEFSKTGSKNISPEKKLIIKENLCYINDEIKNANLNLSKSFDYYSYDFNRLNIEYKIYMNRLLKLKDNFDNLIKEFE